VVSLILVRKSTPTSPNVFLIQLEVYRVPVDIMRNAAVRGTKDPIAV